MGGEEFREKSLDEVAKFRNGKAISPAKYLENGKHPVFGANGQIAHSEESLYDEPVVVIGRVGAYCGSVHYVAEPSWVTDNAIAAVARSENHARFLYYLFGHLDLRRTAIGSAQPLMTQGGLKVVRTIVPPLKTQQAIACILGALDDKIALNRRMNRTLEEMARAIFRSWFVDFDPVRAKAALRRQHPNWTNDQISRAACPNLNPEIAALFPDSFEDSELGEIPRGWRVGKVGEICEFAYGKALKADQRKAGSVPVMGSNGQVGVHDQALVKGPGIIVGRKGNPGIVKWVNTDFFPIDTTFYVVPSGKEYPLTYLCYALEHLSLARFGADSAVPGLNRQIAYGTQLVIPDSKVLESFGCLATSIRDRQHATETESRTLAALRDALLPKLISGELRVQDAERIVGRCL